MTNCTVRGGSILPRTGWIRRCKVHPGNALYQGGFLYDNFIGNTFPYLMLSIGGEMYQVRVDSDNSVVNLSAAFGISDPANVPQAFFVQGEEFLIKQAGDGVTLPLFWDGAILRRSIGPGAIVGVTAANFIVPAAGQYVDVTLSGPYAGAVNQIVMINNESYIQVESTQSITLQNVDALPVGFIVPAGSQLLDGGGALVATTLANFVVPPLAAPVALPVWVTPAIGAPIAVTIGGFNWNVTAVAPVAPPAANHVYLVNISANPTDVVAFPANLSTVSELPAATAMDYYMGRIWYAQDRQYTAGDIVLGPAGTTAYRQRDSILKITENPLALAGDGFVVPTEDGIIRALKHTANLDAALGEGQLFAFTRKTIYSLSVPVTRSSWINSTEPLQKVAQLRNGSYGDRNIINVNGDLFYLSWDGYRSLFISVRNFSEWGNTPISRNINRLLNFNDRALLTTASGIYFDNRMLQTGLPVTTAVGTAFQGLAVLDFDLVSSIQAIAAPNKTAEPAWEGWWQGIKILQLFEGDYGGLQRAFAVVLSDQDGSIEVWELTTLERNDQDDTRVEWFVETPAWTWGREFELKRLDGAEIWIDRLFGTVYMDVYYRPDAEACWQFWHRTEFCSARTTCEDLENPVCYAETQYGENYKFPVVLPAPPHPACQPLNRRPMNIGYQFQMKIVLKGWCRIRGIMVYAIPVQKAPFEGMTC
jgi:hypothetical protein